ncbi:DUF2523 family protein [Colwellia sp. MB02u-14]|uniref:DUF2523 family protein n=1 Tax=Colwellia sp. MB02u-14 TaxID=2759815 RepID=UPI0015F6B8EF|nr:DUF2523 family protein [Colwellia sp. MB02u-14]MBA6303201.1 DUF2523 domain-containing protein [Colwellia sp. MB02u-14]
MFDFLTETYNEFLDFLYRLLLSLKTILQDFFIWALEQLMNVGKLLLDSVGSLMSGLNVAQYFEMIPPETGYYLNLLGVSQALGMIVTCLSIRFFLQLIPFVRWGS